MAPSLSLMSAACTSTRSTNPFVSTIRCRLRPLIFFSRVVTTIAAGFGGLDALRVDDCNMGLFVSVHRFTHAFTQQVVDAYPGSVLCPLLMVIEHGTLGWEA